MKSNKILFRAYRRDPEEFRGFVNEVRSNCRDAGYDRSYVSPLVYDHFSEIERKTDILISETFSRDLENRSFDYALAKGVAYIFVKPVLDKINWGLDRFGHKKLDLSDLRFRADKNRKFLQNPTDEEGREKARKEEVEKILSNEPWYIRIMLRSIVYVVEGKYWKT